MLASRRFLNVTAAALFLALAAVLAAQESAPAPASVEPAPAAAPAPASVDPVSPAAPAPSSGGTATEPAPATPAGGAAPVAAPVAPETPASAPAPEGPPAVPGTEPAPEGAASEPASAPAAPESAPASAPAPEEAPEVLPTAEGKGLAGQWGEMLHYIKIGREDAARSFAEVIAESTATDREIYQLSETTGAQPVLAQGTRRSPKLKEAIDKIQKRIAKGYEDDRSDPQEIARQIENLGGSTQAYALAVKRLQISGEYTLPLLAQKLADPSASETLKLRIVNVLPQLGKEAVNGLCAALASDDAFLQKVSARALGELQYPHGAPYLKELIDRKDVLEETRQAATTALLACAGSEAQKKSPAEMFYDLARKYFARNESILPDLRYETANVWAWEGGRLAYKPVPRAIYCDVYAMQCARRALGHDPKLYPAVSLWIAANLDKEANLPSGATDPTRGADQPSARYYALAAGAGFLQDVLADALNARNSAVAVGAIEALAQTAGAKSLLKPVEGGAMPLVRALGFPDRRVRFPAALALAGAMPQERFEGCAQVLWVLNEALRQTGKKSAMLLAADPAQVNPLKDAIRAAGYELIEESDPAKALDRIRTVGDVDVLVLTDRPGPMDVLQAMDRDAALASVPVAVVTDNPMLASLGAKDGRIVLPPQTKPEGVAEALGKVIQQGKGAPMSEEDATGWALKAARAVRMLGLTNNPVLDVSRVRPSLIAALEDLRGPVRVAAAEALAVMPAAEAQQAIVRLANGTAPEDVRIAAYQVLSESLRRFGNLLTEELAQATLEVVKGSGSQPLRQAAAQALGAMNLASEKIGSLFLETSGGK